MAVEQVNISKGTPSALLISRALRAPVLPSARKFFNPLQDGKTGCKESGIFFLKSAEKLYTQRFGTAMKTCNPVKQARTSCVEIVGKKQLCERLGWSRTRLDRRLAGDETFPVLERGAHHQRWKFEVSAVVAHLEAAERKGATRNAGVSSSGLRQIDALDVVRRARVYLQLLTTALDELDNVLCNSGGVHRENDRG